MSLYLRSETTARKLRRWIGAAVFIAVAHGAAAALALYQWPEDQNVDEAAGAITADLAPVAVAVRVESIDIAPGPLMEEAAQAARAVPQEKALEEVPPIEEAPLAPSPEVVLPTPDPAKEVEVKEQEEHQVAQDMPAQAEAAPATTAPPRVDAEEVPPAARPSPGSAKIPPQDDVSWQKRLMAHLGKFRKYPAGARSRGESGTAIVRFTFDETGRVLSAKLLKSSGSDSLDAEAVDVLSRSSPLPRVPDLELGTVVELDLPIQFRIHR